MHIKTTLRERIYTHQNSKNQGGGNERGGVSAKLCRKAGGQRAKSPGATTSLAGSRTHPGTSALVSLSGNGGDFIYFIELLRGFQQLMTPRAGKGTCARKDSVKTAQASLSSRKTRPFLCSLAISPVPRISGNLVSEVLN